MNPAALNSDRPRPTRTLVIVAAPAELAAAMRGFGLAAPSQPGAPWSPVEAGAAIDLVMSGVGKANAAGAAARFFDGARHGAVINIGVSGSLPPRLPGAREAPALCAAILATRSVYADEGMLAPEGFSNIASMGFPPAIVGPTGAESAPEIGVPADAGLFARLLPLVDGSGPVATVSTCSGTDELAEEIARRTGAVAEAMEGAAVGFTCRRLASALGRAEAIPFAEVRIISNTTGDRSKQIWDLRGSLKRMEAVCALLGRATG